MTHPNNANSPLEAIQAVLKAAQFAAIKHAGQKRKGEATEPYINHLIEVAGLVSNAITEPDTNLVTAAFLHDTIEDTKTTKEELVQAFGSDVADLVVEVTDDKSLPDAVRKRLQVEHAPGLSIRAQVIKIADKISNLRGILYSPPANWDWRRKREYFDWGKQVVDGLTAPNQMLRREFDSVFQRFDQDH